MRFAYTILLTTLLSAASFGQVAQVKPAEPTSDRVEDVYLARDNGSGKAGDVAETFTTADVPIYCVVMLAIMEPTLVKMNFVAVKVPGVKAESKVVSAAYTTKQGQDRVFFSGRPDGTWVAGTYRIDIFVADKKERSLIFQISGNTAPAAASRFVPARPVKRQD